MRKLTITVIIFLMCLLPITGKSLVDEMKKLGLIPLEDNPESLDFELPDLQGNPVRLSSFQGKVVFLNFWATWCGPCREEMPSMQALYEELQNEGLEIVAVNLQENQKAVQAFVDKLELSFTVVIDKTGQVGSAYGAASIPISYIIDRRGYVIGGAIGGRNWDTPEYIEFFRLVLNNGG